jgi:Na+/H+ antiporter NhaD/arsenite permease-like protein
MGANSYIGNGPNFMVKAIADEAKVPTPDFFSYMALAALVLGPLYLIITVVFFR